MNLSRTINTFCLLLFVSMSAAGQQAGTKTLLWRISGHGLQKPSYLYGTMHLNDKRLFRFGDSVYHAIEQSDGLAIEVNPDELAAYYVNKLFDQVENSKKLSEILKDEDLKKYGSALEKKFNKPASEITARDLVKEKNRWMSDYMEKGEMPTFVDAYLYNTARRQGKWVGGIEDLADQAGLMEDMVDKSDIDYLVMNDSAAHTKEISKGLEQMIALYTSGDLDGLEEYTNGHTSAARKDQVLIKRNIKMARRIDSLVNLRTMFLAIGAAHLPGDTGVIDLLRKKGFTVSPVLSSRKIDEKEYTFKIVPLPWYPVDDSQGLYKTSMPGNPASIKLYGIIEMKFLMDIFNLSGYCTMAIASAADFTKKDSIYDNLAKRMFQTDKQPTAKTIFSNGIEGREYAQVKKSANLRLQAFLFNKTVYISLMSAVKPDAILSDDANKFFTSLTINKNPAKIAASSIFSDSIMGISFTAPAVVAYNKKLSNDNDEGWKISTFSGTDLTTGSYILLYSKEVKAGHYISSDSVLYKDFQAVMKKQSTVITSEDIWLEGIKATKITGRNILQPSLYLTALSILKNGRNVIVMIITDSAHLHSPANDRIFASLRFIPHPQTKLDLYTTPDDRFSCQCTAPLYSFISGNNEQYYSYDSTTSVTFSIIPDTLSKYYWAKDDSSYWKKRISDNLGTDSLLQQQPVMNGQLQGMELLVKEGSNDTRYKRIRLLQDGDKIIKLFVSAEKDFLYSSNANSFFGSFRAKQPSTDRDFYLTPKTKLLLQNLAAKDSATHGEAYTALASAAFTGKDRAALQEAVFAPYYSLYDTVLMPTINYEIATRLAPLADSSTIEFVNNRYNAFTERKDTLKNIALSLLAQIKTRESFNALAQLVKQAPPREFFNYNFTTALYDSLALTAANYAAFQYLASDTIHTTSIAAIANRLMDSGFIQLDQVKQAETAFIHAAEQLLPPLLKHNPTDIDIYEMVSLLGRYKSAAANKMLNKFLTVKSPWLRKKAALELLTNNQPLPAAVVNGLAADNATRRDFYTDLKDLRKKALFPAKYATQSFFAESSVYTAATDDEDDDLSHMVFLSKKTARYKNKSYVFYLYKVYYESDAATPYLGIAGGYNTGSAALEPPEDIGGIYKEKSLGEKTAGELLDAWLRQMEKNSEENSEESSDR